MKYRFALLNIMALCLLLMYSCGNSKRVEQAKESIVFNEVMARNRTGLLNDSNKTCDWIELKNTSADSINLKGFKLMVVKDTPTPDSQDKKENKKNKDKKNKDNSDAQENDESSDSDESLEKEKKDKEWEFPNVSIAGGQCLVILFDKKKGESSEGGALTANLKLPKKGAVIRLLAPNGSVIKELKYDHLSPDQSLALQSDSTYVKTYWQSPGFDNTREGYEKGMEKMADQRHGPLVINELMTRASTSSENWVELKNVSDKEIDLAGYSLSKKLGKKEEYWSLPKQKLQPGGLITIQLAGNDRNPANPLHATFKAGDAETIVLSKNGKFVDAVCGKLTPIGGSIGRVNGRKGFFFFSTPTRNAENGPEGKRFIADSPEFDKAPGVYANEKTVCIRLKDKSRKVHYTLDGRVPTSASPLLTDSLVITKGTVVRAYAEGDSVSLRSNVATATYLPGVKHDLAVMNISLNPSDLYDPGSGIYANGPGYGVDWPHVGANFWKKWTKDAHVEFFDGKEGFSTDCGLRIFGGFSRAEAKKSFRLKFRNKYGDSEVDYDFFDDGDRMSVRDLVLRSGSQDYNRCMIRDEFFTSLMQGNCPELLTQKYRPVALYVNAEYFGLYYIREKIDKHFVSRKLNVPNDSVNIIMSIGYSELGSPAAYNDLMKYVQSHDLSNPTNYEYVKQLVDLQGLIDYKLGEMYAGNSDVGNIRYVRSTSQKSDRKWHFIFYDLDASWVGYKPSAEYYLTTAAENSTVRLNNVLINRLLANKEFRAMFLERLSYHLDNTFSPKNTIAVFDALVNKIRPEMKQNCRRWPQLSYERWETNVAEFRKKFNDKHTVLLNDLRSYLHITPEENKKYFSKY